ncbi:MAG TPA: hypothetical protein VHA06_04795, partial [Candidatus Angelobacter sp.]|nr:hypothetical protein [Candidatus Angelobacter sp.]
ACVTGVLVKTGAAGAAIMLFPLQAVRRKLINVTSTTWYRGKWYISFQEHWPYDLRRNGTVTLRQRKHLGDPISGSSGCEITNG